ncbi:DUF5134 domain-containing protein [Streptomyces sp. NPDC005318]|uniref:DUF5134 domain-containing protein n=1 Tax=Streptomyces sp. NPDC005318 TaxID=3157031 RepID=UPI0033A401A4
MHGPAMSSWLLMALCGVTGAYCLLRMRSGTEEQRRTARAEALMGFGMAAMAVPAAVITPPVWGWAVYVGLFGGAAVRALWFARRNGHHLHHLIGSLAMVYMAVVMAAPGSGAASHGGHGGHQLAQAAGGLPLLTGGLLVYYAVYVLRSGVRLIPVAATAGAGGGQVPGGRTWGARPELALACRLTMGIAMFAMLLTL